MKITGVQVKFGTELVCTAAQGTYEAGKIKIAPTWAKPNGHMVMIAGVNKVKYAVTGTVEPAVALGGKGKALPGKPLAYKRNALAETATKTAVTFKETT